MASSFSSTAYAYLVLTAGFVILFMAATFFAHTIDDACVAWRITRVYLFCFCGVLSVRMYHSTNDVPCDVCMHE